MPKEKANTLLRASSSSSTSRSSTDCAIKVVRLFCSNNLQATYPIKFTGGEIALDCAGFQVKIDVPSVEIKIEFSNLQISSIEVASFKGGDILFLSSESLY